MQWKKIKLRTAQEMLKISTIFITEFESTWAILLEQLFAEGEGQINE